MVSDFEGTLGRSGGGGGGGMSDMHMDMLDDSSVTTQYTTPIYSSSKQWRALPDDWNGWWKKKFIMPWAVSRQHHSLCGSTRHLQHLLKTMYNPWTTHQYPLPLRHFFGSAPVYGGRGCIQNEECVGEVEGENKMDSLLVWDAGREMRSICSSFHNDSL